MFNSLFFQVYKVFYTAQILYVEKIFYFSDLPGQVYFYFSDLPGQVYFFFSDLSGQVYDSCKESIINNSIKTVG
jgi:hypothetical protein